MDHLPIVLNKGKALLQCLSEPGTSRRSVCPSGKLLGVVDSTSGSVRVHSLTRSSSGREECVSIDCAHGAQSQTQIVS